MSVRATPPDAGRWGDMDMIRWFDLGAEEGVAEVHEALTPAGLALELHVVSSESTVAWWEFEDGRFVVVALVGEA